jgi:hypothetical protein
MAGKQYPAARDRTWRRLRAPQALPTRTAAPVPHTPANVRSADEGRRSGRANKGQHRNRDLDEPVAAQKPKGKAAKGGKKAATPQETPTQSVEPEDGEEEEEETIYRCVCGVQREIGGRDMICCDNCDAWQHNVCLGLPSSAEWGEKPYFCEQCKPEDHRELLAAMARGEKPWARKKGSKNKPRASDVKAESQTPQPSSAPKQADVKPSVEVTPTPAPAVKESSNGATKVRHQLHSKPDDTVLIVSRQKKHLRANLSLQQLRSAVTSRSPRKKPRTRRGASRARSRRRTLQRLPTSPLSPRSKGVSQRSCKKPCHL